jgi:uncharacterized coiled-coil protein SlyX
MTPDALETLQIKIAYLEHSNAELSDVVSRQQRDIDSLREQMASLAMRLQALRETEISARTPEDERPPHY